MNDKPKLRWGTFHVFRYTYQQASIETHVLDVLRDQLSRRQPMEGGSRNLLRVMTNCSGYVEVCTMASNRLEIWLQSPKVGHRGTSPSISVLLYHFTGLPRVREKSRKNFFQDVREFWNMSMKISWQNAREKLPKVWQPCFSTCNLISKHQRNLLSSDISRKNIFFLGLLCLKLKFFKHRDASVFNNIFSWQGQPRTYWCLCVWTVTRTPHKTKTSWTSSAKYASRPRTSATTISSVWGLHLSDFAEVINISPQ